MLCLTKQVQGSFCERDIDECSMENICFNGGQCINTDGGFKCECKKRKLIDLLGLQLISAFGGKHCDEIVPLCKTDTCSNGGLCIEKDDSFICACAPGFHGERCELPLNECPNVVCYNNGNCTNGVCHCPQVYLSLIRNIFFLGCSR